MVGKKLDIFLLSIDDGFCEWQFKINPKAIEYKSIDNIYKAICKALKSKEYKGKLRR